MEELDAVDEALLGTPPSPPTTLRWRPHPTDPDKCLAGHDMHSYVVAPEATQTVLRIYESHVDDPIRERRYSSPAAATAAAERHYQHQLKRALHTAEAIRLLPAELRDLAYDMAWEVPSAKDDERRPYLCAWLGIKDFDDPVCRSEFAQHVFYVTATPTR